MRTQLSLFVPDSAAASLEAIRRVVDPVQGTLIPAHVTLCRDEELDGLSPDVLGDRLKAARPRPLTLTFGAAERAGEHGILLPCIAGHAAFRALRARVLDTPAPRELVPHLTLAHARNPKAAGNVPSATDALAVPLALTFTSIRWIEREGAAPWRVRHTYGLDAMDE